MSESTTVVLNDQILGWLAATQIVRVASVSPSGQPNVAPFWFHCDGERIVISTLDNSTVRNVRAGSGVAVLVDLGTEFRDLRGAVIHGRATAHAAVGAPPAVLAAIEKIERAHAAEIDDPVFRRYDSWETRHPVYLEVVPERASWYDLGEPSSGSTGGAGGGLS